MTPGAQFIGRSRPHVLDDQRAASIQSAGIPLAPARSVKDGAQVPPSPHQPPENHLRVRGPRSCRSVRTPRPRSVHTSCTFCAFLTGHRRPEIADDQRGGGCVNSAGVGVAVPSLRAIALRAAHPPPTRGHFRLSAPFARLRLRTKPAHILRLRSLPPAEMKAAPTAPNL